MYFNIQYIELKIKNIALRQGLFYFKSSSIRDK